MDIPRAGDYYFPAGNQVIALLNAAASRL